MFKIGFVGVPCSGKTTMARKTADYFNGTYIPEVARILIESQGRPPTQDDQEFIMRFQSELENSMVGDFMVSDVTLFMNHIYYRLYWGDTDECKRLYKIAERHKYDLIFHLSPLPYKEDGVRYQTKEELDIIDEMIKEYDGFGKYVYVEPTDLYERLEIVVGEVRKCQRK